MRYDRNKHDNNYHDEYYILCWKRNKSCQYGIWIFHNKAILIFFILDHSKAHCLWRISLSNSYSLLGSQEYDDKTKKYSMI